jgi:hypothetical protein
MCVLMMRDVCEHVEPAKMVIGIARNLINK